MKIRIGNHKLMIETVDMIRLHVLIDHALLVAPLKLRMKCTSSFYVQNTQLLLRDYVFRKMEHHLPNFKHLLLIDTAKELMNSSNYFVNFQVLKFTLSCFYLRRGLLSIQSIVT